VAYSWTYVFGLPSAFLARIESKNSSALNSPIYLFTIFERQLALKNGAFWSF
jgi:hypothetical protein